MQSIWGHLFICHKNNFTIKVLSSNFHIQTSQYTKALYINFIGFVLQLRHPLFLDSFSCTFLILQSISPKAAWNLYLCVAMWKKSTQNIAKFSWLMFYTVKEIPIKLYVKYFAFHTQEIFEKAPFVLSKEYTVQVKSGRTIKSTKAQCSYNRDEPDLFTMEWQ